MNNFFRQTLIAAAGEGQVLTDEPMKNHTSFRIGGPADYFVMPRDEKALLAAIAAAKDAGIPYTVIGNGTNLLVGDKGYRGVIIQLYKNFANLRVEGERILASSGVLLSAAARLALRNALTGMEFASGIPGTLGGAVVMNAGAYGGEMKDIVESVRLLKPDGSITLFSGEEMQFSYRSSRAAREEDIILGAVLKLTKGDMEAIRLRMEELKEMRTSKQPLDLPSAGSTFKRPAGYFAGKLIMDAGMRGFRVGGAMVSEKHCGFVVNIGDATASDVVGVMEAVGQKVQEQFQVTLEPEVKRIGEF
ncbi:MAG: UDP-N-acetylmuramate dehydrogenase [Lachnospiraceae bacterium]|nr:UDP-N-acetylmuramate dehydrogenase [Lachnospiraceae bacterium]